MSLETIEQFFLGIGLYAEEEKLILHKLLAGFSSVEQKHLERALDPLRGFSIHLQNFIYALKQSNYSIAQIKSILKTFAENIAGNKQPFAYSLPLEAEKSLYEMRAYILRCAAGMRSSIQANKERDTAEYNTILAIFGVLTLNNTLIKKLGSKILPEPFFPDIVTSNMNMLLKKENHTNIANLNTLEIEKASFENKMDTLVEKAVLQKTEIAKVEESESGQVPITPKKNEEDDLLAHWYQAKELYDYHQRRGDVKSTKTLARAEYQGIARPIIKEQLSTALGTQSFFKPSSQENLKTKKELNFLLQALEQLSQLFSSLLGSLSQLVHGDKKQMVHNHACENSIQQPECKSLKK